MYPRSLRRSFTFSSLSSLIVGSSSSSSFRISSSTKVMYSSVLLNSVSFTLSLSWYRSSSGMWGMRKSFQWVLNAYAI